MAGQFSLAIPVADSTPVEFTIGDGATRIVVAWSFENALGFPIQPGAGSRLTFVRSKHEGYVPKEPLLPPQTRVEYRKSSPFGGLSIVWDEVGIYDLVYPVGIIQLVSSEDVPAPGAAFYRYFLSTSSQSV